jgi:uncharacterized repeat protein (TIGR01451 family)
LWGVRRRFLTVLPVATFVLTLLLAAPAWAQPNLSITKDGPATVEPGEEFVYTIVVRNTGEDPATGVVVTDRLPEGVTFVESDPPLPTCTVAPDPADPDRQRVTCTFATLGDGNARRIELTVQAPTEPGEITNRATVVSDQTEEETSNPVTTLVAPRLEINKLDNPDPVREEGLLLYTLRVTNEGDLPSGDFFVIDDLPLDKVDFIRVRSSDDFTDCEENGGLVRCRGNLDSGETGTVDILVEAEEEGTIQNTAEVRADGTRVDADTESTRVEADGGGGNGNNGGNNNGGNNPGGANAAFNNQFGADPLDTEDVLFRGDDEILADTIPDRQLPFTGGPLLPFAGGFLLLAAAAGIALKLLKP